MASCSLPDWGAVALVHENEDLPLGPEALRQAPFDLLQIGLDVPLSRLVARPELMDQRADQPVLVRVEHLDQVRPGLVQRLAEHGLLDVAEDRGQSLAPVTGKQLAGLPPTPQLVGECIQRPPRLLVGQHSAGRTSARENA